MQSDNVRKSNKCNRSAFRARQMERANADHKDGVRSMLCPGIEHKASTH